MEFEILNPLDIPDWDSLVLATGKGSIFHSAAWARVLYESYGYKPVYFTVFENGNLSSVMPFMEVNSRFTGKRGVSLPFTDFCDTIASNGETFRTAVNAVREYGKERSWKSVEWRGNTGYFEGASPCSSDLSHALQLGKSEDQVFSGFKSNTRRNIKKALKKGVRVEIGELQKSVESYYKLHCCTRRDHGLPPQPFSFFRKIYDQVIAAGYGFTVLGFVENLCIAGAVYLHFGESAIFKFGASNRKYRHLRPNNLVMWEAIRECLRRGFTTFSFGRTETDNKGLLQFKRGWNPEERQVNYYQYDLNKNSFRTESMSFKGFHSRIFSRMPIPVLRFLGSTLYKHFG
jgi:hypothetical protein